MRALRLAASRVIAGGLPAATLAPPAPIGPSRMSGVLPDAPPARRFVQGCARRRLAPAALAELADLSRSLDAAEWSHVLELARAEGVASLVFSHTATLGLLPLLPVPVVDGFRQAYRVTLVRNRRMQTVQTRLLRALAEREIPVVPLKGLGLMLRYYGELALRPTTDIDILVPREHVPQVCAIVREIGYRPSSGSGQPTGFNAQTHAVVDYLRAESPQIEVHWELFNHATYRASLPAAAAWARAERTVLFGQPVCSLDPADELRYLSVHYAVEHRLARLIWGVDIAELVGRLPASWDWDGFVRETIAARLALPVAMALGDCQDRLGLSLPPGMLDTLRQAAGSTAEQEAWADAQAQPFSARWIRAHAAVLRGPVEWAIFLRGVLAPRAPALATLYGAPSAEWPRRARTHLRHLRRVTPELLTALRAHLATIACQGANT